MISMFEDRLYDNIMEEMMSEFGAEVRTDEGSLASFDPYAVGLNIRVLLPGVLSIKSWNEIILSPPPFQ